MKFLGLILPLCLVIFLPSCSQEQEFDKLKREQAKVPGKAFDSTVIDKNRIGVFGTCDEIRDFKHFGFEYSVDTNSYEDQTWLTYRFFLNKGKKQWVEVQTRDVESPKVAKLTTNSSSFKTQRGICVGMKLSSIFALDTAMTFVREDDVVYGYLIRDNIVLDFQADLIKNRRLFDEEALNNNSITNPRIRECLNESCKLMRLSVIGYCNNNN